MRAKNQKYDFEKIMDVIIAFNSEKNYYDLLDVILTKLMEMTNADGGTLYVIEDKMLHYHIIKNRSLNIYQGANSKIDFSPIKLDESSIENISAYAAINNEIVYIDDVYENNGFNFAGPKKFDFENGYLTRSMVVLPLTTTISDPVEVIGVIQLINAIDRDTGEVISFGNVYDPPVLPAISKISANTLANLMYSKEIKELFHSFVRVMSKAIDERSPYNNDHTNSVAKLCENFSTYLSERFPKGHKYYFSENRIEQLVMSAYLHDIGKLITPRGIMDKPDRLGKQLEAVRLRFDVKMCQVEINYANKLIDKRKYEDTMFELREAVGLMETANMAAFIPDEKIAQIKDLAKLTYTDRKGDTVPILTDMNMVALTVQKGTLTEAERAIMKEHVSVTARLLDEMKFNSTYKDVPRWAKSHHEYLDGTGYPLGLSGDEVTTEICILAMMDIYDALTARYRPYKKAMTHEKALDILSSMAVEGKLDSDLVKIFIESKVWAMYIDGRKCFT